MKKSLNYKVSTTLLLATALMFTGCNSKKYFEPEHALSAQGASTVYGGTIVNQSRDGATLSNGTYIGKSGLSTINLGSGYRFLSESSSYVLASNPIGSLKIIKKSNGTALRTVELNTPVVSASIKGDYISYILNNNSFGLYSISKNKKIIQNQSGTTYAIDTRAATPIYIDNLAVFPMLDGKLAVADKSNPENTSAIYLSSNQSFNNVIFLSRISNTLVAATPKKLILVGPNGQEELRANISDINIMGGYIYLFTKDGEIRKLDMSLNEKARTKFDYVHFSASTAVAGKIFGLDQKGSLIVLNSSLTKHQIYDIGEVSSPVFITGTKLYKDGNIINLSKLGYEK